MTQRIASRFLRNQSGNVLLLTGLLFTVLVALSGMGIDLGRQQLVRIKLQQASDAAALAGALTSDSGDPSGTALRYFNLNFPATYMDVARPTPTIAVGSTVSVSARASVKTVFLGFLGTGTLVSAGSSVVDKSARSSSDYDVVMVVDESGSESAASPPYANREQAQQAAMRTMANSILPATGTVNPNVRIGFVGFSGYISNKWGLSSKNADALAAINQFRPLYQNFDHTGLLAAANMLKGGKSGTPNNQITQGYGAIQANTDTPPARTARTNDSDANGLSKSKYAVFISDGGIMYEPSDDGNIYGQDVSGLVHKFCPGRHFYPAPECYAAFLDACTQVKNAGGTDAVHLFIINLETPITAGQKTTLTACASSTLPGSTAYSSTIQPDATKDFFYASDATMLGNLLSNITTTIKKTRITE